MKHARPAAWSLRARSRYRYWKAAACLNCMSRVWLSCNSLLSVTKPSVPPTCKWGLPSRQGATRLKTRRQTPFISRQLRLNMSRSASVITLGIRGAGPSHACRLPPPGWPSHACRLTPPGWAPHACK